MPATKNTPSTHHPRRRNVTTLMVRLKKTVTYAKISPKSGEPQRYSWGTQKKKKKKKNFLKLPTGHLCSAVLIEYRIKEQWSIARNTLFGICLPIENDLQFWCLKIFFSRKKAKCFLKVYHWTLAFSIFFSSLCKHLGLLWRPLINWDCFPLQQASGPVVSDMLSCSVCRPTTSLSCFKSFLN